MFDELKPETFDAREKRILDFWKEWSVFQSTVEGRKHRPHFTFYDGPPFATGLPHYGHLLAGTIKDVIPRYKTMKGYCVPRRFGWDCHGLPIENEIEKAFDLSGAPSIEAFGIGKFNEECQKIVLRYTHEWKTVVERMGRWVDFDRTYRTMDKNFMESVWWVFHQLWEKGLIYEGFKVMPFSAKLGTPLSNFEAGENYKDVDDPALTIAFETAPNTYFLAWTTTPWTLVSNLALMVGPEIDYVTVEDQGKQYILAESALKHYWKEGVSIVARHKGQDLVGQRYRPLFPYFADREAFRVIGEPGVVLDEGTGIVHSAPAFGEMDFYASQREGIQLVCPVDNNGRFTADVPEYQGQFVKDADKAIARRLKEQGNLFHQATIRHRYPFCWRSDTPLIYKAVNTWFVAVEKIRHQLVENNKQIHWTPDHIKFGRFGKWLEHARDWAISRNRYWGTPLPIWRAEDGEIHVIGNVAELEKLAGQKIEDLHRHHIDGVTFTKNGKHFKRVTEVFDCWFESGSMPYAQEHYPMENKAHFEAAFPADFIAEGLDQTRGWFYTLTVLAGALFNKPAFKNVIVNGIILAADGNKMSKRLRNYPDPIEVVSKYGADAVRLYMMNSPAVRADDLCFVESGVELVLRQVLLPMWNAYSFFLTYARIYKWRPEGAVPNPEAVIDKWILSLLNKLVIDVGNGLENYDLSQAVGPFVGFVDQLTNWYIRRSRRRFWEEKPSKDREEAFATLYHVLVTLVQVAAPFVPFITEAIFHNLRTDKMPLSVHQCDYPTAQEEKRDALLEQGMVAIQRAVSLGHALRKEHKLKVRQPLPKAEIACSSPHELRFMEQQQHLIADELNVKKVHFFADDRTFVILKAKPNFRVLGKKIGKHMKEAQEAIQKFSFEQLSQLLHGESLSLQIADTSLLLTPEDVAVEREVIEGIIAANEGELTIALDKHLTDALLIEGLAREMVNKVNTMRRETGLDVTDRITLHFATTPRVQEAFQRFADYIKGEVLATEVHFGPTTGQEWDLNGEAATVSMKKV